MNSQRNNNNKKVLVKDLRGWGVATTITLPLVLPLSPKNYEVLKGSKAST